MPPVIKLPNDYFQVRTYTGFRGLIGHETRIVPGSKTVSRSLRFNDDDSAYLNRTLGAGNRKTWTFSAWVKRGNLGTHQRLLSVSDTSTYDTTLYFLASDTIRCYSGVGLDLTTTAVFRDPSSWYHVLISIDTTQATTANRASLWVNGVKITSFSTATYPAINADLDVNRTVAHEIGRYSGGSQYFDGYIAEVHFVDGLALDPSNFGEFNADGIWVPKTVSLTSAQYGLNGFYLPFTDNTSTTTLGYDAAPTGTGHTAANNWTLNNFSVAAGFGNDSLEDTPTNGHPTLDPIDRNAGLVFANGNLEHTSGGEFPMGSTIHMPWGAGKWYCEFVALSVVSGSPSFGLAPSVGLSRTNSVLGNNADHVGYSSGGAVTKSSLTIQTYSTFTTNDIISVAYDATSGKLWFGKNGAWNGDPVAGTGQATTMTAGVAYQFAASGYASARVGVNFGQRPFAYTPPTGFQALCTANLPAVADSDLWFKGQVPDLIWIKGRSGATHHKLVDTARGVTLNLSSSGTGDQTGEATVIGLNKFGLRLGDDADVNTAAASYVMWAWKKGVTPGFDIVDDTGTGSAKTVPHSLGAVPHLIIRKSLTSTSRLWGVYHRNMNATPQNGYLSLSDTAAYAVDSTFWNNTAPTSSVFSVGTYMGAAEPFVTYLFAEVSGFSRFGSYMGNGSTDGPFVWCGFRPRWVMIKRTDGVTNWEVFDSAREPSNTMIWELYPNSSSQENASTSDEIDFVSNGFKIRSTNAIHNASGGTYIFAAFAEAPFQYSNAR